jgi:hypothetical protein
MVADPLPMGILMTQAPLTQVFQCVNSSPDLKDELICVATPHEGTQEEDVRMSVRVMLWYSRIKKMRAAAAITTATLDD